MKKLAKNIENYYVNLLTNEDNISKLISRALSEIGSKKEGMTEQKK
jgi:hypothetical protein